MKIILSRKGFDSANGGMPSPILPNGIPLSIPIPASTSPSKLCDLNSTNYDVAKIVSDLSNSRISENQYIHLDPDIDCKALNNRIKGWRGAFGQIGAAQKHLLNQGVGVGDIFLFFGWFREVEQHNNTWGYRPNSPDLHVIYGWLFVDEVLPVYGREKKILNKHPWLSKHPHLAGFKDHQNTIYIGSKKLPELLHTSKSGYGNINKINKVHILTDTEQEKRSVWRMPSFFYPTDGKLPLSYHGNENRWKILNNEWVTLKSVGRGQEFVMDLNHYPESIGWVNELLK